MTSTLALVLIASVLGGLGHVVLAKGMKLVGVAAAVGSPVARALANPWVLAGVALQAAFFFMYMALLSREDVSKILPLTTLSYLVVGLLAQFMLAEPVTPLRWTGIGLIVLGVLLVGRT
jgi:drug/metabolite transporter (DMT)-like permease